MRRLFRLPVRHSERRDVRIFLSVMLVIIAVVLYLSLTHP